MTALQQRRVDAKAIEASRQDAYHNGADTVVVGLRMSRALRDALVVAKDSSNSEFGGGALSPYVVDQLIKTILRDR